MHNLLPCAWAGTVKEFLASSDQEIMKALTHQQRETGDPQLFAWRNSLESMKSVLRSCLPEVSDCGIVLEYELPRSGGRRPDLVFLNNGVVLVVEFKNRMFPEASDYDQVLSYVRDLSEYHSECREKTLVPVLIPLGYTGVPMEEQNVKVVATRDFNKLIKEVCRHPRNFPPDTKRWIESQYEPLPALVESARLLFENKPLPRIRTAEAENIGGRVEKLELRINQILARKERALIILTGVPGSGKTLVGLQIAYSRKLSKQPVMLSGNGPLIEVLQYVLDSKVFVQPLKNYLREGLVRPKRVLSERVIIFDEAQRAWDRDRVLSRHQGDLMDSEPALIFSLADKTDEGFVVVALMGEGQEIHAGEESGISNWIDAVKKAKRKWAVIGPKHLEGSFSADSVDYTTDNMLNLTVSLRTRKAGDVAAWVNLMLAGEISKAATVAEELISLGYAMRISRNLESAKAYIGERLKDVQDKRTGIIASSKFRKLNNYGVNMAPTRFYYYGQWYEDPPSKPKSGSRFETAISEFGCQGLELDLPLLCWGTDFRWEDDSWKTYVGKPRVVRDPHKLRINAYRVLLTRGRDGIIIFVPAIPELDCTYQALLRTGFKTL